jgi:putative endonuclease
MKKYYYFCIMTNFLHSVLYTGVTNDLKRRAFEHKERKQRSFTSRYNVTKLVYYEICEDAYSAIAREKQIKGGSRQKKIDLINKMNPTSRDMYGDL